MAKAKRKSTAQQAPVPECQDYIVEQMIERGRSLVAICSDANMPSRTTVYRWLADNPDFAARVDRAREAMADHAVQKAREVIEACTQEDANAARVKMIHYHWEAARMAPRKYSERRIAELTGKDGGPIQTESTSAPLDFRHLSFEERATLRELLLKAKAAEQQ